MWKKETILVVGATGTIGSRLIQELAPSNRKLRILTRNIPNAKTKFGSEVEIFEGDLSKPETLTAAFANVDKALVLSPPANDGFPVLEGNAFDAAKKANVKHVINISAVQGITTYMANTPFAKWHIASENHLRSSGINWTIIRPAFFASNFFGDFNILQYGGLFLPAGSGKDAPIDPKDIAAVAAKILLNSEGHEGKIYELTGPELLTYSDIAKKISSIYNRELPYNDVPVEAWTNQMLAAGAPPAVPESLSIYFSVGVRTNQISITDTVEKIVGRPARTIEQFSMEHKSKTV